MDKEPTASVLELENRSITNKGTLERKANISSANELLAGHHPVYK